MFAILFMNQMADQSGFCDLQFTSTLGVSEGECKSPGVWHTYDINFNHIFSSLVSLFVLSTLEGWPDYLLQLQDGNFADIGPTLNNHSSVVFPLILFIFVGSIFCVNLFVAMISLKFDQA